MQVTFQLNSKILRVSKVRCQLLMKVNLSQLIQDNKDTLLKIGHKCKFNKIHITVTLRVNKSFKIIQILILQHQLYMKRY